MSSIPKKLKDIFVVNEKIGNGAYGEVYMAKLYNKTDVAIKFEPISSKGSGILKEIDIYNKILKGKTGFPRKIGSGTSSGYNFLAMELLGPSLDKLLKSRRQPFQLETVCQVGVQLVDRLEILHQNKYIHCDLKPENIAIGLNNQSEIYLFDFGCATKIEKADEPLKTGFVCGTFRYISVAAHEGYASFQSDIESLGYVLAYLVNGVLPWDAEAIANNAKNVNDMQEVLAAMLSLKKSNFQHMLYTLPKPISTFLAASRCITHTEMPDYNILRNILK